MKPATPTLYLHIGRNKAGSTTLQDHFAANAAQLRDCGIDYVFFGQPSPPGSGLPSFPTHRHIADFARTQPARSVLVSHEGLCCFTPELTRIMASDLARLDTRLIFYIRPYRDWVLSSYNFDVRTGHNSRDIDTYLAATDPLISVWPMLEIWGAALGWDKIRIRSLHRADLAGGDLVTDAMQAMGLAVTASPGAPAANRSPCWWVIELLRAIAATGPAQGWSSSQLGIAQLLHWFTDVAAESAPCPATPYLTRTQALDLAARYDRDLCLLETHTGIRLQPDGPADPPERPFLPGAGHIPRHIIHAIRDLALAPDTARTHPDLAAYVRAPGFACA